MNKVLTGLLAVLLLPACTTLDEDAPPVEETRVSPAPAPADTTAAESASAPPEEAAIEAMRVVGSLTYDQKIPLPVDGDISLSLWESGLASAVLQPVESRTFDLNGRQVPIPFEVDMADWQETRGSLLRLDVRIVDAAGMLLWKNDDEMIFTKQAGLVELGSVVLSPEAAAVVDVSQLAGSDWMVARLDDQPLLQTTRATISFDETGRISGNASCNAFTGSFELQKGRLQVAPLAMTRKACVPQLMQQEQSIITLLQTVSHVHIDETGLLILQNDEGGRITARQGAS